MRALLMVVVLVVVASCGDDDFGEGQHTPLPQVLTSGGPVIASPRFVVVTFSSDPLGPEINRFVAALGTSDYWSTVVSEYGVGSATTVTVPLSEEPPTQIDDPAVQQFLQAHLDPPANGWPAPDESTVYAIYYPSSSVFSMCSSVAGYHGEVALSDGRYVPYVMVPRCAYDRDPLDEVTEVSSHEFAEVATDPMVATSPAYYSASDFAWQARQGGGEIADMCVVTPGSVIMDSAIGSFVERVWSNSEAAAGHDPCVPHLPGDVYFQAAPAATDSVKVTFGADTVFTSSGLHIPVHGTRTVDVNLFGDGPTAPMSVTARQWPIAPAQEQPAGVALSLDHTTGRNGDTLHLTIAVNADNAGEGHEYIIVTAQVGDLQHEWPVVIEN